MSVHNLLKPLPAAALGDDTGEPTCNLWYIRRRLGRHDYGDQRMARYAQLLVDQHAFPPPFPSLKGKALTRAVTPRSAFQRPAVDQWLDDFLPPANAAALDAAASAAAAADMDAAAAGLGGLRLVASSDQ